MTYRACVLALLSIFCLCSGYPADAQDKHALVQKLIEVTDVSSQIRNGAQAATAPIMDQIKKSNPTIPADTFNHIQNKLQGELSTLMESFMDQWAYPIYEKDFSDKELQYVIEFYSSPIGKRFVQQMPIMMQQLATHLPEFLQQSLPKIQAAVKEAAAEKKYKLQF